MSDDRMTAEEKRMLQELHRALLQVPAGSPRDALPLLHQLRELVEKDRRREALWDDVQGVVSNYKRGGWFVRAALWTVTTVAGVGLAVQQIMGWIEK